MDTPPLTVGEPVTPIHTATGIASQVVAAAVWAPSVHNTQPWRFSAHGEQISLLADGSRRLMVADPGGREMMISCGAALFTGQARPASAGLHPRIPAVPGSGGPPAGRRAELAGTCGPGRLGTSALPPGAAAPDASGWFRPATASARAPCHPARRGPAGRRAAARRCRRRPAGGAGHAGRDGRASHSGSTATTFSELGDWVPPPWSIRRDGVPHTSYPARPGHMCPYYPGRDFAHGHGWGVAGFSGAPAPRSAGVVCLLTTGDDGPADWVRAGQALQRVLLTCATCGVAAALHSQPLELGWLRELVRGQVSDGGFPQLILRLGTGHPDREQRPPPARRCPVRRCGRAPGRQP